jgi:hypothetical protein
MAHENNNHPECQVVCDLCCKHIKISQSGLDCQKFESTFIATVEGGAEEIFNALERSYPKEFHLYEAHKPVSFKLIADFKERTINISRMAQVESLGVHSSLKNILDEMCTPCCSLHTVPWVGMFSHSLQRDVSESYLRK